MQKVNIEKWMLDLIVRSEESRMVFVLSSKEYRRRPDAIKALGMTEKTFYRKVQKYDIDLSRY